MVKNAISDSTQRFIDKKNQQPRLAAKAVWVTVGTDVVLETRLQP